MPRHARQAAGRLDRLRWWATFDWWPPHRPPSLGRFVLATAVALAGSVAADGLVVATTEHLYPVLRHYAHFTPVAWVALTVVGILGASAGWPVVAAFTRRPRWLFGWMAFAVTLVLWLPDLALLGQGDPGKAVAALMTMHLAIAVVTYESLVRLAPERPLHHPWVDAALDTVLGAEAGDHPGLPAAPAAGHDPVGSGDTPRVAAMQPVG